LNQRLLAEIGRTQRLEILNTLKRTRVLSVNQLVTKMKMSYMGIKQHCLTSNVTDISIPGGARKKWGAPRWSIG